MRSRAGWAGCEVDAALEDAVLVGFAAGAVAGVEAGRGLFAGEDADAGREDAVERAMEVGGGDRGFEAEADDLRECVDAGVGAAGALREDLFAGEAGDRF